MTQSGDAAGFDFRPERIGPVCLVTGGSGYLGRALLRRLVVLGCEVRSLDLRTCPELSDRVDQRLGDVRLLADVERACEGVDCVFHTVALINLLALYRPETRRRVFDVNLFGTEQVVRACRRAGVGRLVYASTINVAMGEAVRRGDETQRCVGPGDLLDLYAESKSAAERSVLAADGEGGLRTAALRLAGLWGPGEGALMIDGFLEQLARGRFKVLVGDGKSELDNLFVENAVDAHLLAAMRLAEAPDVVGGQAYFITDDEPMNGVAWFRPLVEGLGHAWPQRRLPGWLMYAVAWLSELAHLLGASEPMLTRRGIRNLTRDSSFRIDKARRELGYEPRVRSAEGLRALLPEARLRHDRIAAAGRR